MARYLKTSAQGTVGTGSADLAFEANGDRVCLWLQALSSNTGKLYVRFGVDPASDGSDCDIELTPGSAVIFDSHCVADDVRVIGSASGQEYRFFES